MVYLGSKQRIIKNILPYMLSDKYNIFVDLFCGGCSVIENVPKKYRRIANDKNFFLISMWKEFLAGNINAFEKITKEEYNYYNEKRKFAKPELSIENAKIGWVGFLASFRGKFFNGYAGATNGRNYINEHILNILQQKSRLDGVEFICEDYSNVEFNEKSIIYCDPPYKDTTGYCEEIDHNDFYKWVRQKINEGHRVFISEYTAPADFVVIYQESINNSMNNTTATEKLFVHETQYNEVLEEYLQKYPRLF